MVRERVVSRSAVLLLARSTDALGLLGRAVLVYKKVYILRRFHLWVLHLHRDLTGRGQHRSRSASRHHLEGMVRRCKSSLAIALRQRRRHKVVLRRGLLITHEPHGGVVLRQVDQLSRRLHRLR